MDTRFNLYDLFGIFFPGAILCLSVFAFLAAGDTIDVGKWSWSASLALLPVAYVVGLLVHHYAKLLKIRITGVSLRIVKQDDHTFPADFKEQLVKAIQGQFGIVVDPATGANTQIAFDLCYDYVIQSSAGVYTENVNALYGLCRSMIVVSPVLGLLSAFRWGVPAGLVVTLALVPGFVMGMRSYANRFAVSVYRSFYVTHGKTSQAK